KGGRSGGRMHGGSGDHQPTTPGSPVISIGKMPRRYAPISVDASRSAPAPIRSWSDHSAGGGKRQRASPTGCGFDCQVTTATFGQWVILSSRHWDWTHFTK